MCYLSPEMLVRFFPNLATYVTERWARVLLLAALAAVGCGVWAWKDLSLDFDREALVNSDLDAARRLSEFRHNFDGHGELVVVVEGGADGTQARPAMKRFADELAGELRRRPDLFHAVHARIDPDRLGDLALLYLPLRDVETLAREVEQEKHVLRALEGGAGLAGWLSGVRERVEAGAAGNGPSELASSRGSIDSFLGALRGCADAAASDAEPDLSGLDAARGDDGYAFVAEGRLLLVTIEPVTRPAEMIPVEAPLAAVREAVTRLLPRFPGLRAGVTGRPAIQADEMITSTRDMVLANVASVLLVALLFIATFRSVARPLLAVATLIAAIAVTFGFATGALGRLNLLSSIFAVVLVSEGINYGVHVLAHYQAALANGAAAADAVRDTFRRAGGGLLLGGLTTACAFSAPAFAEFQGLAELGVVSGVGIVVCLVAMFTVFPALLVAVDGRRAASSPAPAPEQGPPAVPYRRVPRVAWPVFASFVVLAVAAGLYGRHVGFDYNLLRLQSPRVESVHWERTLIRLENRSSFCASVVADRARLEELRGKYRALSEDVLSTEALFPEDESEKRSVLASIGESLKGVEVPASRGLSVAAVKREASRLRQTLRSYVARDERAEKTLSPAVDSLTRLASAIEAGPEERVRTRLAAFERALLDRLAAGIEQLRRCARPGEVRPGVLPPEIERRLVGRDGRFALLAYPKKDVWEMAGMEAFASAVRSVDPEAVGAPLLMVESHTLFVRSFRQIVLISSGAILLFLLLGTRSFVRALVAASPLAVGMAFLLALMRALDLKFDFANFFAVPILIGSAVDNGVHLVHAYASGEDQAGIRETYQGILVSTLTTMLGFGTLILAEHAGLVRLGTVLALGSAVLLVTFLVFVPAFLAILPARLRTPSLAPPRRLP